MTLSVALMLLVIIKSTILQFQKGINSDAQRGKLFWLDHSVYSLSYRHYHSPTGG